MMQPTSDRYQSFADLSAHEPEGQAYLRHLINRSESVVILAPHGGGIEPGTSELACAVAGGDYSLYVFDSLKKDFSAELHLTSTRFDDPACLHLLKKATTVLALHGCLEETPLVYVGGLDQSLVQGLLKSLRQAGFRTLLDGTHHAGRSPRNLCNRGATRAGVQLELSNGLRTQMFAGMHRAQRQQVTPVFERFVSAVRAALPQVQP